MNQPPFDPLKMMPPAEPRREGWPGRILMIAACLVATGAAVAITFMKWTGRITDLAGCSGGGGCDAILSGRWANWMMVPVSFWALCVYIPLLVLACLGLKTPTQRKLAFIGTSVLVAAAGWFLGLQLLVEQKFCKWCLTMHVSGIIAFGYTSLRLFQSGDRLLPVTMQSLAITAFSMTTLVAGQIFGPQPDSHEITEDTLIAAAGDDGSAYSMPSASTVSPFASGQSTVDETNEENDEGPYESNADDDAPTHRDAANITDASAANAEQNSDEPTTPTEDRTNHAAPSGDDDILSLPPLDVDLPDFDTTTNDSTSTASAATIEEDRTPADDELPSVPGGSTDDNLASEETATSTGTSGSPANSPSTPSQTLIPATHHGAAFARPFPKPGEPTQGIVAEFFGGGIRLQLDVIPHIGNREAKHQLVKYYDYTCPACKNMHDDLHELMKRHPGDIVVLLLPCPLHHRCNKHLPPMKKSTSHDYACQLAGYGLAVWRANPEAFEAYHNKLFELQGRVTPDSAKQFAAKLVGEKELEQAMYDPYVPLLIRHSTTVFGKLKAKNSRMPKLLLGGQQVLHGVAKDSAAFIDAAEQVLQLK